MKRQGEEALDGFAVQKQMFDHLRVNFFGAAAAIVGLQAEVGTLFSSALFGAAIAPAAASSGVAFAQVLQGGAMPTSLQPG